MPSDALHSAPGAGRLEFVDIARGVMILAVALSHAWFADSDILGDYLPFSMPVFFFLSGYTSRPGRSWLQRMGKRCLTLLAPYFLFCAACNLCFPIYAGLVKKISVMSYAYLPKAPALWLAVLKADPLGMLMSTPMWFLAALFTASILFFAVVDRTRDSLLRTAVSVAVLLGVTLAIEAVKPGQLPWFVDLAPYAAALMLLGAWCGGRRLGAELNVRNAVIGLALLAAAEALNRVFPGSARTSVVEYIASGAWYGVLTAFVIAVTGSLGTVCVCRLLQEVPGLRRALAWIGKNSLWILCVHYCVIMLLELWLYTKGQLSNSLLDVVNFQLYGFGKVSDTPKDIAIKISVALVSVGAGALYAVIHGAVKGWLKRRNP